MRINLLLAITFFITATCQKPEIRPDYGEYREITDVLSIAEFEEIKSFILEEGDREVFSNMYSDNPHLGFSGFNCYLTPEVGQLNAMCDPEVSDFNKLVIQNFDSEIKYLHILLVRRGDLKNPEIIGTLEGMKEKRVYLLNYYEDDLAAAEDELKIYLNTILDTIR